MIYDGKNCMKRFSKLLTIREMQVKAPMKYYCTPVRISKSEKCQKQILAKIQRNWITRALLVGMYNGTTTLEKSLTISFKNVQLHS